MQNSQTYFLTKIFTMLTIITLLLVLIIIDTAEGCLQIILRVLLLFLLMGICFVVLI